MASATAPLTKYLKALQARLAACEKQLGITPPSGDAEEEEEEEVAQIVLDFDEFMDAKVKPFVAAGAKVGGEVQELTALVENAYRFNRDFIVMSTKCKKPAQAELGPALGPLREISGAVSSRRDRSSPFFNHQTAVGEAIAAFSWVVMSAPTLPKPFVETARDGAQMYLNRVRKDTRESKPDEFAWCNAFYQSLDGLLAFVSKKAKTGLDWNPRGGPIADYKAGGSKPAAAAAGGAPTAAAPKPDAADVPKKKAAAAAGDAATAAAAARGNLFAQLNSLDQSQGRTAGLRHVTKDMKAKNQTGDAPKPKKKVVKKKAAGGGAKKATPTKPPRLEKIDTRWFIEYQTKEQGVVTVSDVSVRDELVVHGCTDATIVVTARCKAIQITNCKKTNVVFEGAVSSVDVINCQRVKVQVKGTVPSINIDKTDGITAYLSFEARQTEIATSKSSEMNVSFPASAADDAEWVELPIPEQFITRVQAGNTLDTNISDLYEG